MSSKLGRKIVGSLLYNEDIATFQDIDQNISNFYFDEDISDFYNNILLKIHRVKGDPITLKVVEEYINKSKRKRDYRRTLEILQKEVKKGKKIYKPIEIPPLVEQLKKERLNNNLFEKLDESLDVLEENNLDDLDVIIDNLTDDLLEAKSILEGSKDEELLLHNSVGALEDFQERWRKRKEAGGTKIANYGYKVIDEVFSGIRNSDLIAILGSAKQFKSTLLRNICYNLITQAKNVVYFTHEMSFEEVEASFLTLHINNRDRFPNFPRVTYKDILEGNDEYEDVILEAYNDLVSANDIGVLYLFKPQGDYDIGRFKGDIKRIFSRYLEFNLIAIDSINLWSRGDMHEVDRAILEVRQLTLGFNNNRGVPVMSPFQIKRSHFVSACDNEGNLYTLDAVRYYSEINTSSTRVISTIQTPDMEEVGTMQIQNLLSRDTKLFPPTQYKVDGEIGKILELDMLSSLDEDESIDSVSEEDLEEIIRVTSERLFDD